jgi:nucleoside-diphosphate kinase
MIRRSISIVSFAILALVLTGCFNDENKNESSKKQITLSIIKQEDVNESSIGDIITRYEKNGLRVAGMKLVKLDEQKASEFYAGKRGLPFYDQLVETLTSGPVVLVVLEGDNVVDKNIELMEGSGFDHLSSSVHDVFNTNNTLHLSENPRIAEMEVSFFFKPEEVN